MVTGRPAMSKHGKTDARALKILLKYDVLAAGCIARGHPLDAERREYVEKHSTSPEGMDYRGSSASAFIRMASVNPKIGRADRRLSRSLTMAARRPTVGSSQTLVRPSRSWRWKVSASAVAGTLYASGNDWNIDLGAELASVVRERSRPQRDTAA
jgi:hypothetical protein